MNLKCMRLVTSIRELDRTNRIGFVCLCLMAATVLAMVVNSCHDHGEYGPVLAMGAP